MNDFGRLWMWNYIKICSESNPSREVMEFCKNALTVAKEQNAQHGDDPLCPFCRQPMQGRVCGCTTYSDASTK